MLVIFYQVYQIEGNASDSLNLPCLDPEIKIKCYNRYFINEYIFYTEKCGQGRKTYNNEVCVKRLTFIEFEVVYYRKLQ
jgi:hypothetical protein